MALLQVLRFHASRLAPGLLGARSLAPAFASGSRGFAASERLVGEPDQDAAAEVDLDPEEGVPEGRQNAFLVGRAPQLELVQKYLDLSNASAAERKEDELRRVRAQFARFAGDTGSTEVQVAALTTRIQQLSDHLSVHKKDHHSRRGLTMLLNRRRSLLVYLRRTDFSKFSGLLSVFNLKDNYASKDRFTKYDGLKTLKARQAEAKLKQKRSRPGR